MKKLLSFEEFVNEHYNYEEPTSNKEVSEDSHADAGFDPENSSDDDVEMESVESVEDLVPGKEYTIVDGDTEMTDMVFQGVTDGSYIFNSEDQKIDKRYAEEEIEDVLSSGAIKRVAGLS